MSDVEYCKENVHSVRNISGKNVVLECDDYGAHKKYKTLYMYIDGESVGEFVAPGSVVDEEELEKK